MSDYNYAKLRPIEVKQFVHEGQPVFFLRDPLELSPHYALVPQQLGIILVACDGTLTLAEIQKHVISTTGVFISQTDIERFLSQLDEIYLLDNERATEAIGSALEAYRNAPYRKPALAGLSYPAEPDDLWREMQALIDANPHVEEVSAGRGLFSPHIDYFRGGKVYARVWKRAAKLAQEADIVVVFGTDHNSVLPGQITLTRQNYATPFGLLPTDQEVVDAIIETVGKNDAFAEEINHIREHSIELVVTWLHFMRDRKPCHIVPILTGSFQHYIHNGHLPSTEDRFDRVIDAIRKTTSGRKLLVVASGDLAHLGPAFGGHPIDALSQAKIKTDDDVMLAPLVNGNADAFFEVIRRERGERNVCGTAPFYLSMKLMGSVEGEITAYDRCLADEEGTSFVSVCGMVFG